MKQTTPDPHIIYSSRKTLGMQVRDGRLIIRAPIGTSDEKIRKMMEEHRDWIEKALARSTAKTDVFASLTDEQIKALKKLAHRVLPEKTACYAAKMRISYQSVRISSAKTRFGSCTSQGTISYSWRLMMYPEEAIDYVVVHELAHRKQMNHSAKFYAVVAKVLPDYPSRKKLLKGTPKLPESLLGK